MPSTELTNVSLAKMKLLTRSAVLVRNVGNRLRMEVTIPNCEVICTSKHGHGGGKIDRWWEQQAVKSMSMCDRSQNTQQWWTLPMFDLSPPTQSCVTTGPWSEKWECCTTWTDAVHPAKKASTIAVWERYVRVEAGRWIVYCTDATWKFCVGKRVDEQQRQCIVEDVKRRADIGHTWQTGYGWSADSYSSMWLPSWF